MEHSNMPKKYKERKIAFPQMGNLAIPISSMFKQMNAEVILPPKNNNDTLTLGTRYSVETVCLPYKLVLGNFIQALDKGANTLLMFQAPGTCRLGNYASNIEAKLRELGYDFDMVIFDMYKGKLKEIATKFSQAADGANLIDIIKAIRLAFFKFDALDIIEKRLFYFRPREYETGNAEKLYQRARIAINNSSSVTSTKNALNAYLEKMNAIPINTRKQVLKISITGEFYVLLDPFANMEIEKELGLLGCEIERQVMMSDWTNNALKPKFMHKKTSHRDRSMFYASLNNYMLRAIGGDCVESIGDTVYASKDKVDGVVHIGPFNCTPEIVSQSILPHVSQNENIPVLSLVMDEHTGKAGMITRLEAFVDLISRRKYKLKPRIRKPEKELVLCT